MLISILVPHKLRARVELEDGRILWLFPNMIGSLTNSLRELDIKCDLVVADFGSEDYPLERWLKQETEPQNIRTTILDCEPPFNRGRGLNLAAKHATGDYYCFMDTDMLLGREFWLEGIKALTNNYSYFPICYSFSDPEHTMGWWRDSGFGMSIVRKEIFTEVGGVKEYKEWGREDDDFVHKVSKLSSIYRPMVSNYYHQWHPQDLDFKNKNVG